MTRAKTATSSAVLKQVMPITARETAPNPEVPDRPSLDDLIEAYRQEGRPRFHEVRSRYEKHVGLVKESFYAKHLHAGALVVKPCGLIAKMTQKRKIYVRYDGTAAAIVQPEFEAAIWRARRMERESGLILGGRSRKVLLEMLYSILVYLLGVLDATMPDSAAAKTTDRTRVETAIKAATTELDRLERFAADAAQRASLRWYLLGLPLGLGVCAALVATSERWSSSLTGAPSDAARVCFAAGAIGGIVSVMARITRREKLSIDSQQGHGVTLLAGGFRPIIGSVFGLALYVFVSGGLVPIAVPDEQTTASLFFSSLAFFAGFSERWAQDTIVHSAPSVTLRSQADPEVRRSGRAPARS